jgi:molybdate transport system regulatory protein
MPRRASPSVLIIRPRLQLGAEASIGPGKIELLRKIGAMQSISAAAREMDMTYKRAWMLIDTLNKGIGKPVVVSSRGGKGGGGAQLTPLGEALIRSYDVLEARIRDITGDELAELKKLLG